MTDVSAQTACYTRGSWSKIDCIPCYLFGGNFVTGSMHCYTTAAFVWTEHLHLYMAGALPASSSISCFATSGVAETSSIPCYMPVTGPAVKAATKLFLSGVERSSTPAYLEGIVVEYAYVILETSNAAISLKFRVIAQGYDDGTLEKAENLERTIGGGLNVSQGGVYTIWNPIVRVRQVEDLPGYGTTSDLENLYRLNNPNGTPSNKITFIDHHGVEHLVLMSGTFKKALMGVKIEGNLAWSTINLRLIKIG